MDTAVTAYFGKAVVEQAIADYFSRHGCTEDVRDDLMLMAVQKADDFFQMVDDFIMKKN
jgi:predicted DNA-binding protein (UPF0278 family)